MTPEHEVRALIDELNGHRGLCVTVSASYLREIAATLEALLDEQNTAVNCATVSGYESRVADGADAERDRVVEIIEAILDPLPVNDSMADVLRQALKALARNEHRSKDDEQ